MDNVQHKDLTKMFVEANAKFFRGRLPKYRVVFTSVDTMGNMDGQCLQDRLLIRVAKELRSDPYRVRRTLLHEMCHHGCPHHGKRFLAKLKRLADLGEEWAGEEIEEYQGSSTLNQDIQEIKSKLEILASSSQDPRELEFAKIEMCVAGDFGYTREEIRKKIPWLRSAWEKAVVTSIEKKQRLMKSLKPGDVSDG